MIDPEPIEALTTREEEKQFLNFVEETQHRGFCNRILTNW